MLPREKLFKLGPAMLEDYEILAIIIGSGSKANNVFNIAKKALPLIYKFYDKPNKLCTKLNDITGLGKAQIAKIIAILELEKRLAQPKTKITDPKIIYKWFYYLTNLSQEHLFAIFLDASFRYIKHQLIFKGILNNILLSEREIFMLAYKAQAPYIILIHNHPSGTFLPSDNDIQVTKILIEKAFYIGLTISDHIIVAREGYFSFKENNMIN